MKKRLLLLISLLSTAISTSQITWDPIISIASATYGNNYPRMVLDAAGNPLVSWGNMQDMMFSRWNGTSFTTPVGINPDTISIAEMTWQGPDMASDGNIVYAVYKETPEGDANSRVWCQGSTDGGMNWSAPVPVDLYVGMGASRFPTVVVNDAGNPVVAYMKFDMGFGNARWVVAQSTDGGANFGIDTIASGWSSPTSDVCDCCPGSIVSSPDYLAVSYRDNNSNVRDTWIGVSTDGGVSFTDGMGVDQMGWVLASCPSSGPDAYILDDTIISVFMNGESGQYLVYYNKSSLVSLTGSPGIPLAPGVAGLSSQNYPRISSYADASAVVWKQVVSGADELAILFTNDIHEGFSDPYELVASEDVVSTDVVIGNGVVHVVWQNNVDGTVRYRKGTLPGAGYEEKTSGAAPFPNPSQDFWNITPLMTDATQCIITDVTGNIVYSQR